MTPLFWEFKDEEDQESDHDRLVRAYKRASIGLGIAAVIWVVALFVARDEEKSLIPPIGAAVLSGLFYSLYLREKESP